MGRVCIRILPPRLCCYTCPDPFPPSIDTLTNLGTSVKVTNAKSSASFLFTIILSRISSAISFLHVNSSDTVARSKLALNATTAVSPASPPHIARGPMLGGSPSGFLSGFLGGFPGGGPEGFQGGGFLGTHPPPPGLFAYDIHVSSLTSALSPLTPRPPSPTHSPPPPPSSC